MVTRKRLYIIFFLILFVFIGGDIYAQVKNIPLPSLDINLKATNKPSEIATSLQVLLLLTVLSLAPAIIIMTTSFIRIAIVFSFARTALALQQMPPNQVIMALALFLTFFIMAPTFKNIYEKAYKPYQSGKIDTEEFFDRSVEPLREFMFKQIGKKDREVLIPFIKMGNLKWPRSEADVPTYVLIPAFMLNELKKSFYMGIIIFIPFIIIDMLVASVLMSMGMIMLPPVMVSLPFKIILFVLVDGWTLLVNQLIQSFM
ncbi:MAG: flagellar type III secretion system pore protein FliP [Spirochaetota bacterium]|nr:flagellar type III secretion system pore protein FliP [Spirochaetota bacterium]